MPLEEEHEGSPVREERESERAGEEAEKPVKEKREAGKAVEKAEAPPKAEEIYKGEPDATGVLRGILESHPDIDEKVKNEIMSWAELRGQLDPQSVAYLLGQMKGVSAQTASILAQKYSLALQKAQLEGRPGFQMPMLPQLQFQQPMFQVPIQGYPSGQPYLGQPYFGQSYFPQSQPQPIPSSLTEEKVAEIVGKILAGEREKREKEEMISVVKRIERGELSPKAPQAPPMTKEEMAEMAGKAASEVATKIIEARAKEDAEQRRHGELLSAIRSGAATQQVSGYKEDSYRFLGQGITAAAQAFERKEPLKIVIQHLPEILGAPPGPKEIAPGGEGAETARVISQLKPEWVAQE